MAVAYQEDIIRKIDALLAKANGTDNEHERDTFMRKANEMILKHAVDQALLGRSKSASVELVTSQDMVYSHNNANLPGKKQVAIAAATMAGVRVLFYHENRWQKPYRATLVWIGYPTDIQAACVLYASLIAQASRAGVLAYKSSRSTRTLKVFMTSFLSSFGSTVSSRARKLRSDTTNALDTDTSALVVAREDLIAKYVQDRFNPRSSRNGRSTHDSSAWMSGHEAGKNADLGQTKVGTGAAQLRSKN